MKRLLFRLMIGGGVVLMALFAVLWIEHTVAVDLPVPTGPFAVGRLIGAWVDPNSNGAFAPTPQKRELLVWIWYPATAGPAPREEYVPAHLRAEVERTRGLLLSKFLTRDLSRVHPHSLRNADLSPGQRSYPVVIMRAGSSAEVWNYSTLAEDLASHGYVVVAFDAPYRTSVVVFPDGRVMKRLPQNNPERCLELQGPEQANCVNRIQNGWTADISFVLDELQRRNAAAGKFMGRLDLSRVGVFGHSFGGGAAAQFCSEDSRCTAGIDLDGAPHGSVIRTGMHQPFMFLLSDHGNENDPESTQIKADIKSIYDRVPPERRLRIVIRGANHFLFSDDGGLLKSHVVMRILRAFGILGIDGRRQLAITTYCIRTFFDAHLKGPGFPPPHMSTQPYPEIEFLP